MNPVHALTETRDDTDQAGDQPLQSREAHPVLVGESIPAVCHIADLCRIFQIGSLSTFHRREQRGDFKKFELRGGGKHEWSGYRIAQHLTGQSFSITVKRS